MAGSKEIEFLFARNSAERQQVYKNNAGDMLTVHIYWKFYGGTLKIESANELDLEGLLANENSEWKSHEFEPDEGYAPDEIVLDPENDDFEDILIEQDIGLLEGKLSEDGYTLISDEMIFEPGALELAS
ncbi:MAG: hypothetical protein CMM76_05770 [Rhodospirillaceae bacterium]|nr:hypothetical protein [Rhodospirillaceae bacterium]